ncbi:MAG: acetolactate synthase large subunit, partial [Chloroflexota bacterium]|nr:acetolactate synthase large subunit [Chloroflexota bacterium]
MTELDPAAPDPADDQPAEPTADPPQVPSPEAPEAPEDPIEAAEAPIDAAEAPIQTPADPEPEPEPIADPGPRTVGRFIADALRIAGVRYAFTVPGESFLGLLDVFEDAGIRVIATRHEGAAAFMAEAHGQLTGRPAVA